MKGPSKISARSLASAFGKYTQGLAEITAALPLQLAHHYACCQQKLSGQVNSSYQAAESTSCWLENSPDLRIAHGSVELRELAQSVI